jgi:hypothetical protein
MTDISMLLADGATRTTFEWGRIQSNADWILPIAACIAILLFVRYLYRRDAIELRPVIGWLLTALRTAVFFGLLILFLQPHWRSEREMVRNSRVALLVDTSLSMGLTDGESTTAAGPASRAQQIVAALGRTDFLARLRKVHDVVVVPFSEDLKREQMVTLGKEVQVESLPSAFGRGAGGEGADDVDSENSQKSRSSLADGPHPNPLRAPTEGWSGEGTVVGDLSAHIDSKPDWSKLLAPTGTETQLGQALRQLIQSERGAPISGVVVLSDGGQNAGIAPDAAVELAQEAKIPIFTVGLGSDRPPANVAVCDLAVPARAYPGDRYTVTGFVQAQGMAGSEVTVELLTRPADDGAAARQGVGDLVETRRITLGGDGEVLPVKFELTPDSPGRRTLCFRLQTPAGDRNPADNLREADVEIVDRKNHVLLLAGGPMREYHFLRNQLFRDRSTTLDVLLQSGKSGLSQEARKILDDFPTTREEMYDYDCVVAFDPNWQSLSAAQVELLEKWVGEQSGGLIVVAGSVNAGRGVGGWTQDPAMTAIRNLYPVEFPSRLAALESNVYASKEPWPLDFTREGLEADFLWLGDTATAGRQAWAGFPGVYGYCSVRGPKPGAAVLARFSDPRAGQGGQQPAYFAGQFYGSGSVFYMGSGEMWRLRAVDETYFEQFYTKLIRHVSQGRLLRGSSRGVLLVGQDRYMLGNTVEVRAQLTNIRLEPLDSPGVSLQVIHPDGAVRSVAMRSDATRAGAYLGQFPALEEGVYRLELPVPESDNQRLTRRIQVKAPDLERENPRRNDALLSAIANGAGGRHYVGIEGAIDGENPSSLEHQLRDRTSIAVVAAAPNPRWEETWRRWMMVALCGALCLEWLIRRLVKLA